MNVATVRRIGLYGGPVLAAFCFYLLPIHYSTGPGEWVEFSQAGRTTAGMMVWMATWWLTEAVDIEVTALLPIVAFPSWASRRSRRSCLPRSRARKPHRSEPR